MPLSRRLTLPVIALLVLVTTTSCMRTTLDLDVRPDNTVGGIFTAAWSDEFLAAVDSGEVDIARSDLDAFVDALFGEVPRRYRFAYEEDGFTGESAKFTDLPLEEFDPFISEQTGTLSIQRDGRQWEANGYWDLRFTTLFDQYLGDNTLFVIAITFPATVTSHNGALSGRTVTWDLAPGGEYALHADALANDGWLFAAVATGSVVAMVGIILLAQLLIHRSRRREHSLWVLTVANVRIARKTMNRISAVKTQ